MKKEGNRVRVTESRETETGKSEKELWDRLDELEREEEEFLAKEKEEEEREVAAETGKENASNREEVVARTTSEGSVAGEWMTTKAPQTSKTETAAAAPLRITVKHSSSQPLPSAEPQEVGV